MNQAETVRTLFRLYLEIGCVRETWNSAQAKLAENAARAKRRETAASPSPLAGEFLDETGDRLTPSHATGGGRRYRYYTSHRLIARSGEGDLDGWRLPATALESAVTTLIRNSLTTPASLTQLMTEPTPAEIATARNAVADLVDKIDGPCRSRLLAALVESGRIAPGRLMVTLDRKAVAKWLGASPGRIEPASLTSEATFTLRRRGIEAKLVLDAAAPAIDHALLRNIASGWMWFEDLKRGTSMQAIARRENLSQRRIARLVDLAFLPPDIIEAIVSGRQSVSLTSDALIKSRHRPLWAGQRAMIVAL